jgi:hypothetical protein
MEKAPLEGGAFKTRSDAPIEARVAWDRTGQFQATSSEPSSTPVTIWSPSRS